MNDSEKPQVTKAEFEEIYRKLLRNLEVETIHNELTSEQRAIARSKLRIGLAEKVEIVDKARL